MKVIAFYLPQFHPIPENDRWWGKGFTEWTNVTKVHPFFEGHYQPRRPADLGFYDLRLAEVRIEQARLAEQYGLHGFCYYYYWFNGKKLLDLPLTRVLETKEPKFPFCICYANENWTRRWDGQENDILIKQRHSPENDRHFIRDLIPLFADDRYIRIHGRPMLLVYRTRLFPDPLKTAMIWREEALRAGVGDLYLCKCQTFEDVADPKEDGFDAMVEFPPHSIEIAWRHEYQAHIKSLTPAFKGYIYDYQDAAHEMMLRPWPEFKLFKTAMLAWDNSARKGLNANIFHNFSTDIYENWLARIVRRTNERYPEGERIVFINAWNEWAEGTYLEPDQKYGHEYLMATNRAISSGRNMVMLLNALREFEKQASFPKQMIEDLLRYIENMEHMELRLAEENKKFKSLWMALDSEMNSSHLMRVVANYKRVRDKLFPVGTRRRQVLKSLKSKVSADG
jgi:lipopolysaccharide biosynthesis protein